MVVAGRDADDSNPTTDVEVVDLSTFPPVPCFKPANYPFEVRMLTHDVYPDVNFFTIPYPNILLKETSSKKILV